MINRHRKIFTKYITYNYLLCSLLLFLSFSASSQITVYPVQDFNFGTFYQGNSGGTVDISTNGSRSATGDIILLNSGETYSQTIFDIEAPVGSVISILNGPDTVLPGSNGGSITLKLKESDPASPFITSATAPARNRVQIAGSLIIGDKISSPPGNYTGSFSITFHQE